MDVEARRRPPLPPEALYLPFEAGPHRMALGLVARHPDELVELDEPYPAEMAERRDLLDTRRAEVFAATAGSEAARRETLDRIAGLLPRRHPRHFRRDGETLHNRLTGGRWDLAHPVHDPLDLAGRLVQEDLCLVALGKAAPPCAPRSCARPAVGACMRRSAALWRTSMTGCRCPAPA